MTGGYIEIRAFLHYEVRAREPFCTESQLVVYYDKNFQEIANAHQYLRQDGSLGASGKPDPKMVVLNEIIYKIRKQP